MFMLSLNICPFFGVQLLYRFPSSGSLSDERAFTKDSLVLCQSVLYAELVDLGKELGLSDTMKGVL